MDNPQSKKMSSITSEQDITIELATKPAYRLWLGREKSDKKFGILGLPGFCKLMRAIEQSIRSDDPYADYYFHVIEQAMSDLDFDLEQELKDIQSFIDENVPSAMKLPDVGSKNPVVVPIRFASRVGFQMVYKILKVDQIVLKVLLASHIGILPNKEKFETIARVERRVRSVINLIFKYRHTGVTRDDMAANNQKAQKAKELMGDIEQSYLQGTTRSENAPSLPIKRLKTLKGDIATPKASLKKKNSESEEAGDLLGAELEKAILKAESESRVA